MYYTGVQECSCEGSQVGNAAFCQITLDTCYKLLSVLFSLALVISFTEFHGHVEVMQVTRQFERCRGYLCKQ